jgi:hypothetical protein
VPRFRGHHLICLQFFNGDGYDENFIKNLRDTLSRADGELVTVGWGADDICASCLYLRDGKCGQSDGADTVILQMDRKALELLGISIGKRVMWDMLRGEMQNVFPQWFSFYCRECEWRDACGKSSFYRRLLETR